jgi:hypothetical protein
LLGAFDSERHHHAAEAVRRTLTLFEARVSELESAFVSIVRNGAVLVAVSFSLAVSSCERAPTDPHPARDYRLGDHHELNVQFGEGLLCSGSARDLRTGRVVAISERAIVLADVANPAGGFTDEDYVSLAADFDGRVWPALTHNFGAPFDVDRNNRVVLFFTRAVNELVPPDQQWYVGGVTVARDLFPLRDSGRLSGCPGSNYAELIYMPVPDPLGEISGHERERAAELRRAPALMSHELQHVINASRRLYGGFASAADWSEAIWLNEGLSHIAEELMGYAATDLAPGFNIGIEHFIGFPDRQAAFSLFMQANLQHLAHYLEEPDTTSLHGPDSRAARGAAWQFLRYAADRRGGSQSVFWSSLAGSGSRGLANIAAAIGTDAREWLRDWVVAVYTDDMVPGVPLRYRQPSWNFRGLYPYLMTQDGTGYGRYPLRTRALSAGSNLPVSLAAGTAAYIRFAVPAGGRAEIRLSVSAASCLETGPVIVPVVGEVVPLTGVQQDVVCLHGGAEGAEFVYIPFNAAAAGTQHLSVRGTGVTAPGPEQGAAAPGAAAALPGYTAGRGIDWEIRLRERERRELSGLVGAAAPAPAGSQQRPAAAVVENADLMVTLVRTR